MCVAWKVACMLFSHIGLRLSGFYRLPCSNFLGSLKTIPLSLDNLSLKNWGGGPQCGFPASFPNYVEIKSLVVER